MDIFPNEINRLIWKYLYPTKNLINNNINDKNLGTSINNILDSNNYCYKCGELMIINKCKYCNIILYKKCNKCIYTSINYDFCCYDAYTERLI